MHFTRADYRRRARAAAVAAVSAAVTFAVAQTAAPPAGVPVPKPTLAELMTGLAASSTTSAASVPAAPAAPVAAPAPLPPPAAMPPAAATATAAAPLAARTPSAPASLAAFLSNAPPAATAAPAPAVAAPAVPAPVTTAAPTAVAVPAPRPAPAPSVTATSMAPRSITVPPIRPTTAVPTNARLSALVLSPQPTNAPQEPLIPPIPPTALTTQAVAATTAAPPPAVTISAAAPAVVTAPAAVAAVSSAVPPAVTTSAAAPAVVTAPAAGTIPPPSGLPPSIASNVAPGSAVISPTGPAAPGVPGVPPSPGATPAASGAPAQKLISLSFQDAPIDQVLQFYAELTGRTMIRSPGLNAIITLKSQSRLPEEDVKEAIESVLALNNITMVPLNDKFFKVIAPAGARQEGMPISFGPIEGRKEGDNLVTHVVELKHIELVDVMTVLQGLLHGYGKIQPLERNNSLMITDSRSNLQRVLELIEYLDKPVTMKIETRVYELREAEAAAVAAQLNELIADSQNPQRRTQTGALSGTATVVPGAPATPPGVIRAPVPSRPTVPELSLAERGIVVGQVKIVADERTNVLIVISDPANFVFFDNIIAVLDRAIEPEIVVNVYPLEFADAEEVATLLNELIGSTGRRTTGSSTSRTTGSTTSRSNSSRTSSSRTTPSSSGGDADSRSQSIRDFIARQTTPGAAAAGGEAAAGSIGELSPNTRILSDVRSNSILLMGRKTDITVLEEVTKQLDVVLAQVVVEAVILEVNLSDNVAYGVDWLQRSLMFYEEETAGANGGIKVRQPVTSFGGGFVSGSGASFIDGSTVTRSTALGAGGLTYFLTAVDMNLDAVIRLAASSSDAKILSTPVILTTDNQEATIVAGEERPIVNATTVTEGGNQTAQYEYRNIGIELTVKPHVTPNRVVVMDVQQTADNVGDIVQIDGNDVPVITKREMKAQISVEDRSTIILGGLISNSDRKSRTKVPFLGDIPILGRLFRSDDNTGTRTELLVLLTPYVIRSPDEARMETRRLHDAAEVSKSQWYAKSWADGDLARRKRAEDLADKLSREDAARGRGASTNAIPPFLPPTTIPVLKPRTLVIPSPGSSVTSAPPRTIPTTPRP